MRRDAESTRAIRPEPEPGRKARIAWLRMALDLVAIATMSFLLLTTAWLRFGVSALADRYSSKLTAQLVFRNGLDEGSAAAAVRAFESKNPSLRIRLISDAELRGMLALQDSWMKNMPDVSLSALPTMAEIAPKDPTDADLVWTQSLEALRTEPEVDYIIFDDAKSDALRDLHRNVDWYSRTIGAAFACIAIIILLVAAGMSAARLRHFMVLLFVRSVILGIVGVSIGYAAFRAIAKSGESRYPLPDLDAATTLGICGMTIGLWFAGSFAVSILGARAPQTRVSQ